MSAPALRLGLCGVGTVGSAVLNILSAQQSSLRNRTGTEMVVSHIGARSDRPGSDYGSARVSRDVLDVARDPEVQVVVELIGGTTVAYELVKLALEQGKHVVTANKALLAERGDELVALAERAGVHLKYEASVAGGIPVIKTLREALAANAVTEVTGIINGTGNFILSEMASKGRAFQDVLAEAQTLGYAEADPTFDIDGTDAAHKLVILAALAFGMPLQGLSPSKEGIDQIEPIDLENAKTMGYRIKHLGIARLRDQAVELRVHPTLIPESKPLAGVDGVLNAIMLKGDAVGELLLVGPGAGGSATASSVCADLTDLARALSDSGAAPTAALGVPSSCLQVRAIVPPEEVSSAWYVRLRAQDRPGVMAHITQLLSDVNISIESLIQKPPRRGETDVAVTLLTDPATTRQIQQAIAEIRALGEVSEAITLIRVETFDDQA